MEEAQIRACEHVNHNCFFAHGYYLFFERSQRFRSKMHKSFIFSLDTPRGGCLYAKLRSEKSNNQQKAKQSAKRVLERLRRLSTAVIAEVVVALAFVVAALAAFL